jgi:hypothetical protein
MIESVPDRVRHAIRLFRIRPGISTAVFVTAFILSPFLMNWKAGAQTTPVKFLVDFPTRIRVGSSVGDEMGKAEMMLWIRGDSAFATWQMVEPERRTRIDSLSGLVQNGSIVLTRTATGSVQSEGASGSIELRYQWRITRWDTELEGEYSLSSDVGNLPSVTRALRGVRRAP